MLMWMMLTFSPFTLKSVQKHEKPKTEMGKTVFFKIIGSMKMGVLGEEESLKKERGIFLSNRVLE